MYAAIEPTTIRARIRLATERDESRRPQRRRAEDARVGYVVTRDAPVRGDEAVLRVSVARWVHTDGSVEWCLEYWDDVGEADHDLTVADEAAAIRRARQEFGIEESDWRPGPQPWGRPDAQTP